jgi:hypothetical protein
VANSGKQSQLVTPQITIGAALQIAQSRTTPVQKTIYKLRCYDQELPVVSGGAS